MRQPLLSRLAKRSMRQGQVGQTIVIMAFAFIVLLAFVGIVTDVSLMFVRYTTLRRAVDAAAVAAAGQIRRTVATAAELTAAGGDTTKASQIAFARSVTNINLAARQFIEFYGLSPSSVVVDSCDTLAQPPLTGDPQYTAKYAAYSDPRNLALLDTLQCTSQYQPRKLVQVTAQLQSPTVFLRLIGWGTITLEASAISETAVLDVVLMFDAAESMLKQTTYNDWAAVPVVDANHNLVLKADGTPQTKDSSFRYLPVRTKFAPNWNYNEPLYYHWPTEGNFDWTLPWPELLKKSQNDIYADKTNFPEVPFTWNGTTATPVDPNSTDYKNRAPRQDCRVRFYPYAETVAQRAMLWPSNSVPDDLRKSYTSLLQNKGILPAGSNYPDRFDGFIPAYDYFGCCNDPNGDNNFNDLICQPFKKVRDATESFLDRVDFQRGDRVAFVTFDRSAYLIDPDGDTGPQLPMMTSETNAIAALRTAVGVRAEPNYYADFQTTAGQPGSDGQWDSFVTGGTAFDGTATKGTPIDYTHRYKLSGGKWVDGTTATAGGFNNTPLGQLNNYPVRYNCWFDNATLQYPYSIYSSQASAADITKYGIAYSYNALQPYNVNRFPTPLAAMSGTTLMNPNLNDPAWNATMKASKSAYDASHDFGRQADKPLFSYEFRAACAGNNIGGALREGNNALLDPRTVRIGNTGAVWVMVLLGDGAAGASDPVTRNGTMQVSNPYGLFTDKPSQQATYGAYGLCPYGTADNLMGLTAGFDTAPPRCSDSGAEPINGSQRGMSGPVSRHFCPKSASGEDENATINLDSGGCDANKYDVDDYARDWADFIGLAKVPDYNAFKNLASADDARSVLQLPTIFTIGFGLDFPEAAGTGGVCGGTNDLTKFDNINDCLGEELLRYIADVGDNNRLDTDYEQDWVNDGQINGYTVDGQYLYGDRGPCEDPIPKPGGGTYVNAQAAAQGGAFVVNFNNLIHPVAEGQDCGNYYNAPDGPKLTKVFEDIASRMFTRITK